MTNRASEYETRAPIFGKSDFAFWPALSVDRQDRYITFWWKGVFAGHPDAKGLTEARVAYILECLSDGRAPDGPGITTAATQLVKDVALRSRNPRIILGWPQPDVPPPVVSAPAVPTVLPPPAAPTETASQARPVRVEPLPPPDPLPPMPVLTPPSSPTPAQPVASAKGRPVQRLPSPEASTQRQVRPFPLLPVVAVMMATTCVLLGLAALLSVPTIGLHELGSMLGYSIVFLVLGLGFAFGMIAARES